jgi:glutamate-1-semialdehyde 2,1-aminomutase
MRLDQSQALRERAHAVIPGGAHTYAKGDDQYPEQLAPYLVRGRGCRVWDVDGNEYIEFGMGLRAVTLGHAHPSVMEAASRQMSLGTNFVRPSALEVQCAEDLLALIDASAMVKFAKNGSDVTTAAIKLARAWTGRDMVAICAEHPFFSVDDWFIGTTPVSAGIPKAIAELTVKFHYNDPASIEALFDALPGRIACLVMEPATAVEPADGFLHKAKELCARHGALLVFDELITGFRWHLGGAQAYYGVTPDLSTFGKALGNGFSISALVGRRDIMSLGGIRHDAARVFLLSTTHGAETHCLAAAREVMRIYRTEGIVDTLRRQGRLLRQGVDQAIRLHGLTGYFEIMGQPCNLVYITRDAQKQPSQAFRTLFLQETITRGLLLPSLVVSAAHTDADIAQTVDAVADALTVYRRALDEGIDRYLVGRPVKPVMRTFN